MLYLHESAHVLYVVVCIIIVIIMQYNWLQKHSSIELKHACIYSLRSNNENWYSAFDIYIVLYFITYKVVKWLSQNKHDKHSQAATSPDSDNIADNKD